MLEHAADDVASRFGVHQSNREIVRTGNRMGAAFQPALDCFGPRLEHEGARTARFPRLEGLNGGRGEICKNQPWAGRGGPERAKGVKT